MKKEMTMEVRLLIALVLVGMVLLVSQYFIKPAPAPTATKEGAAKSAQPVFETTRSAADGAAYLVAFENGLARAGQSTMVAEIELTRNAASQVRIDVDPALTMLSRGGVRQATVTAGTLTVRGVTVDRSTDRRQNTRERN
jgi:hypothetical protein